jgi:hypothetical protein
VSARTDPSIVTFGATVPRFQPGEYIREWNRSYKLLAQFECGGIAARKGVSLIEPITEL